MNDALTQTMTQALTPASPPGRRRQCGKVVLAELLDGHSTTDTIARLVK